MCVNTRYLYLCFLECERKTRWRTTLPCASTLSYQDLYVYSICSPDFQILNFDIGKSCTSCPNWGRGEVIWTKSKRTATFFRETFPYIIKESNSPETHISLELNITSLGLNRHKQNYISPIVWPKIPFYTYILSRHPCLESSNLILDIGDDESSLPVLQIDLAIL